MQKDRLRSMAIIVAKVLITLVAFVLAAGTSAKLSRGVFGATYTSESLTYVILTSLVVPVWYYSPILWRLLAAAMAMAVGLAVKMSPLFVQQLDARDYSVLVGSSGIAAMAASVVVCLFILKWGRSRGRRSA